MSFFSDSNHLSEKKSVDLQHAKLKRNESLLGNWLIRMSSGLLRDFLRCGPAFKNRS